MRQSSHKKRLIFVLLFRYGDVIVAPASNQTPDRGYPREAGPASLQVSGGFKALGSRNCWNSVTLRVFGFLLGRARSRRPSTRNKQREFYLIPPKSQLAVVVSLGVANET